MKKPYVKPGMYVENFSLAQSIAAGCGTNISNGKPGFSDKISCGWDVGTGIIWDMNLNGTNCNDHEDADTPVDGMCYNNPNGGNSIFTIS